ncbi:chondroitin sulfate N-acetylgalactosaminyltransferase 2 isoform X3 [Tamandua tetradactyla]|uniref:chondroitin sulfate N-acetylgalactosaminyltransferase 2 isoform X3 n=1 Tax=Tamandua tetradactyla TaxID=48850 RepID=UPI00405435C5
MPRRGSILQTRTHWLLLGLALLCSLVLFMYLLECAPQTDGNASLPGIIGENYGKEYYQALLQEQEEHYQTRATSLKRQIAQLKQELQEMNEKMRLLQEKKNVGANGIGFQGNKEQVPSDLLEFLHSQIDKAEVSIGAKLPSYYRTERDKGTQYELFFKKADLMDYRHVTLFRPFGPLMKVKSEMIDISRSIINIIVPLAERTEAFAQFMQNFRDVCIHQDKRIHLTVVYFGKEGLSKVKSILESVASESDFQNYTLVSLNEEFNRGRGLNVGARAWDKGEVLMFFCDVDIYFSAEFLNSCRLNAEPGKKVFYPVVFSLYNPAIVYANQDVPPPVEQQLVHKKDSGFWRDFGFGMTCQYRSDFLAIGLRGKSAATHTVTTFFLRLVSPARARGHLHPVTPSPLPGSPPRVAADTGTETPPREGGDSISVDGPRLALGNSCPRHDIRWRKRRLSSSAGFQLGEFPTQREGHVQSAVTSGLGNCFFSLPTWA